MTECRGEVCPNRVLVKFGQSLDKIGVKNIESAAREQTGGPVAVRQVGNLNVVSISGSQIDPQTFMQTPGFTAFKDRFGVEYAEPDFILRLHSFPSDEYFINQWGLVNSGQTLTTCDKSLPSHDSQGTKGADIDVLDAWSKPAKFMNFVVATLDSGIDYEHPDIKANIWKAPRDFDIVIGGRPIHCPAGAHGFDAIRDVCDPKESKNSHGTNVVGIIGAVQDDRSGTVGVNPQVSVMVMKAFEDETACVSQVVDAIEFINKVKANLTLKADIRIINNSYGQPAETISCGQIHQNCESRVLREAVAATLTSGILFVASAGNVKRDTDCFPEFPANFDLANVIAVSASTNTDVLASDFSNFGVRTTDLMAPGQDICTPGIGGYGYQSGTSMAAPFVTGAAALLLSRCGASLGYADLKKKLVDNADLRSFDFKGQTVTGRRLNVGKAALTCP